MIPWQIIEMTMAVHTPDAPNSMTSDRSEDRGKTYHPHGPFGIAGPLKN